MRALTRKLVRKLGQIKLVATDLDGTLLDNHGEVSEATRSSIVNLQGMGLRVAIMTARAHPSAEQIADSLGMQAPIISLDGGLVRLPHSQANIEASYIKARVVRRLLSAAETNLSSIALFVDDKVIQRESDRLLPSYIDSLGVSRVIVDDLSPSIDRTIWMVIGADSRDHIKTIVRKALGPFSGVRSEIYHSPNHDGRWYLEIRSRNCSKASGLASLERYFKIDKNDVAVVGDFKNDLEAFKRAGIGVAMKNAVTELKEHADIITESTNDEGGAAEFFDLLYKIKSDIRN